MRGVGGHLMYLVRLELREPKGARNKGFRVDALLGFHVKMRSQRKSLEFGKKLGFWYFLLFRLLIGCQKILAETEGRIERWGKKFIIVCFQLYGFAMYKDAESSLNTVLGIVRLCRIKFVKIFSLFLGSL